MGLLKDFKKSQPGGLLEGFRESKEQPEGGLLSGFRTEAIPSGAPSLEAWDPSLKERIRMRITEALERSPFYERGKRLGQLGVHYLSEAASGLGLYIPDVIASKISEEDTLAEALDTLTGFKPTPREVGAGEAAKFVTSLTTVGAAVGPAVAKIPARVALKTILSSGVTFGTRKSVEEIAQKISTGEPIDFEGIHFEGGIGVLFGTGQVGVSKFVKFIGKFRALPKARINPARVEVNKALKHYKTTGDRTQWDAVRMKYAGIKPEVIAKAAPPPPVKEFGKYPLAKAGAPVPKPPVARAAAVPEKAKLIASHSKVVEANRRLEAVYQKGELPSDKGGYYTTGSGKAATTKAQMAVGKAIKDVGEELGLDITDQDKISVYTILQQAQPPAAGVGVEKAPIIPQPTAIVKSSFSEWATDFSATRAQDLNVPLLLNDPEIAKWRLSTLKEIENAQRRFKKTYQKKLARRESPNVFNPWISARHAFMSLGEKTGVPLYHIYDNIMRKGGAANIKGFEEISSRIGIGELSKLTIKDNAHIAEWLFSPKTRLRVSSEISPDTLKMAKKLDEILQGPAAKQVQEMVARRWIKSGKAPPDIWNYPTDVIVNKWMMELKEKKSIPKIVRSMLVSGIPNQTKLKKKIARAASKEGWSAADERFAFTVLSSKRVQAEITAMQGYPKKVFDKVAEAKANKTLPEHIANADPWTRGLGVRKFYYLSDPIKADIIDDYIDSISLRALEKPAIPEGSMPGTISYEAYARTGHPGIKKGSVVNNVLTHLQRVSIANAVADDMETMYDRLTQKVKDPLTGKDTARIPLSDSDSKTVKDIFNNLLMKRQIATRPWAIAVDVKRWFWRTRLSMIARPDATLWMSFRNALQNLGMGPTAFNVKQTSKSMLKYASKTAQGKTMEEIDPQMHARFRRDFTSYVSQRRAFYREFLLQDTANVSREFGNRRVAQKAASLLERTGGMYGAVDEYVNRMPLWIAQYQTTKDAAIRYKFGKIDIKSFLAKSGLDTVRSEQKMMAQDLLDAGRINDLSAESANWMVEDVNLKYKTAERAGVEQTMSQRIFMGIYTFPRGAMELLSYRGIIPMMKGIETGNWNQAKHGLVNTLKGLAAGELAAVILMTVIGKSAYDAWSKNRYELLGPGAGTIADLFGSISSISYQLGQGDMTLDQAGDRLADAFAKNVDEFIPLMKIFSNTVETHYDTKSLNSWKLLRDTTSRKVLGKHVKWDYVSRSDYEKVMHLLIGSYEDPEGHVDID